MATLHTVNKSPFERASLQSCLGHAQPGDSLLLIEDAVVAAQDGTAFAPRLADAAAHIKIYVLGPDLKARGLDPARVSGAIAVVDYDGFVELAAENQSVHAWL